MTSVYNKMMFFRTLMVLLASLALAACGGGTGEGITSTPSENTLTVAPSSLSVSDTGGVQNFTINLTKPGGAYASGNYTISAPTLVSVSPKTGSLVNGMATIGVSAVAAGSGTITVTVSDATGESKAYVNVTSSVQGSTGGGGTTPTGSISLTSLTLTAGGVAVGTVANPITTNTPATVSAILRDASGNPMANQVISFNLNAESGVGALDTSTALTDGSGLATVTLSAGTKTPGGAGTLVATYAYDGGSATRQISFQTNVSGTGGGSTTTPLNLALGTLAGGAFTSGHINAPSGLAVGSSTTIMVNVVDTAGPTLYTDAPVSVTFSSTCAQAGNASFSPAVAISAGGTATTSYSPTNNACSSDTITATATANGSALTATTGSFNNVTLPPNSISFVSATPSVIGIKGASAAGVQETSLLTFDVKDQGGNALPNVAVNFTVQTPAGGFAISGSTTGSTNAAGQVSVTVKSGTVPMSGAIKASLASDPNIYGTGSVSVQQGVATEDRFSVAVETLNPAAGDHQGVTDNVTVRAADRYGNWVPDGTKINFATKLGDIGASCNTVSGTCSVVWTSHGEDSINFDGGRAGRGCFNVATPADYQRNGLPPVPALLPCGTHDLYGVNVITAWTTGEESFSDANGNNQFDDGENFIDLPEAFQDFNLTGLQDGPDANFQGETFQDKNSNGDHDAPDTRYNGLSCSASAANCNASLIDVRNAATMVLSTDNVQMRVIDGAITGLAVSDPGATGWYATTVTTVPAAVTSVAANSAGAFSVLLADLNGNAPPIGSVVKIEAESGTGVTNAPKVLGESSCTVTNAVDPVVCTFSYQAGDAGNSFVFTATGSGVPPFSQTVVVQ